MDYSKLTPEERIELVKNKYEEIIQIMDLENRIDPQHIKETPRRIAKMFIRELFSGCYTEPPKMTTFTIDQKDAGPVRLNNIRIRSVCSHHFVPFEGKCMIEYFPRTKIVGISKLARVADYFARRPQVQEELTNQIGRYIMKQLNPWYCVVLIKAKHLCISHRGANEPNSEMLTMFAEGADNEVVSRMQAAFL